MRAFRRATDEKLDRTAEMLGGYSVFTNLRRYVIACPEGILYHANISRFR